MIYIPIFLACFLASTGIYLFRKSFFKLARVALQQVNVLIDSNLSDKEKAQQLLKSNVRTFKALFVFLICNLMVIVLFLLPIVISQDYLKLDLSQTKIWVSILFGGLGSILPFVVLPRLNRSKSDYGEISQLLHHLALENFNVSNYLFNRKRKKVKALESNFLVVSGLARSGTTAMVRALAASRNFYFLTYADMPFLLNPNLSKKIGGKSSSALKERPHKDDILVNQNSIEALDEYFFKVQLKDAFIKEDRLQVHEVSKAIAQDYLAYHQIVKTNKNSQASQYLTKNNNFLLRYESMRKSNDDFRIIFMLRNPAEHACSLWRQHQNFVQQQKTDGFVFDYMNYLGHHEFGLGHKPFHFEEQAVEQTYEPNALNYWLVVWINYYSKLNSLASLPNTILVQQSDLKMQPKLLFQKLSDVIGFDLNGIQNESDTIGKVDAVQLDFDTNLLAKAEEIYKVLQLRCISI